MRTSHSRTVLAIMLSGLISPTLAQSQTPTWPPPPRNFTQQILGMRDSVTVAAGLTPLRSTPLPGGTQEIRIWIGEGIGIPEDLYRLLRKNGQVMVEWILFWDLEGNLFQDSVEAQKFDSTMRSFVGKSCGNIGMAGHSYACRVRLAPGQNWTSAWSALEQAQVWSLPDESELPADNIVMFDGWGILVEVRDGSSYRAYHHSNPDAHNRPESRQAARLGDIVQCIWAVGTPRADKCQSTRN